MVSSCWFFIGTIVGIVKDFSWFPMLANTVDGKSTDERDKKQAAVVTILRVSICDGILLSATNIFLESNIPIIHRINWLFISILKQKRTWLCLQQLDKNILTVTSTIYNNQLAWPILGVARCPLPVDDFECARVVLIIVVVGLACFPC